MPDPFEAYSPGLQDFSTYSCPSLTDVLLPTPMDFPDPVDTEFLLDAYSLCAGVSSQFPLCRESDAEGTASLVGSSMFPSQYKEAEARVEAEAKMKLADNQPTTK